MAVDINGLPVYITYDCHSVTDRTRVEHTSRRNTLIELHAAIFRPTTGKYPALFLEQNECIVTSPIPPPLSSQIFGSSRVFLNRFKVNRCSNTSAPRAVRPHTFSAGAECYCTVSCAGVWTQGSSIPGKEKYRSFAIRG